MRPMYPESLLLAGGTGFFGKSIIRAFIHGLDDLSEYFEFMLPTHATAWENGQFEWDHKGATTD